MSLTLDIPLGPTLSVEQAEVIYARGKEAVIFALLELAKQLAEQQDALPAKARNLDSEISEVMLFSGDRRVGLRFALSLYQFSYGLVGRNVVVRNLYVAVTKNV